MTTNRYEGPGVTEGIPHGSGFEKWKARRAERAATAPTTDDDAFYEAYVSRATGQAAEAMAGVAHEQVDGGVRVPDHITDDEIYTSFTDMLSGEAGRRRAQEEVRQDYKDRRDEARRHAREMGTPLHPMYED